MGGVEMFRSSLAIAVGGTAAGVGPAIAEVIPQPELRSAFVGLLTALCIAAGDALMRRYRQRRRNRSRQPIRAGRKPRAIPLGTNKPKP